MLLSSIGSHAREQLACSRIGRDHPQPLLDPNSAWILCCSWKTFRPCERSKRRPIIDACSGYSLKSSFQPLVGVIDGASGTADCLSSRNFTGLNGSIPRSVRPQEDFRLGHTYVALNDILGGIMSNKQSKCQRRIKHVLTLVERFEASAQFARALKRCLTAESAKAC